MEQRKQSLQDLRQSNDKIMTDGDIDALHRFTPSCIKTKMKHSQMIGIQSFNRKNKTGNLNLS